MPVFYAVSTGPGNPEFVTLQALRVLRSCEIIFYPQSEKNTIALDTLKFLESEIELSEKTLVPCTFSMTSDKEKSDSEYEKIASQCIQFLCDGKDVAMLSIGDVSLYSTALRTARLIKKAVFEVKFISGVNSFSAAACSASLSLCEKDEMLAIIPADSFFKDGKLEEALTKEGTKVLMKMGRYLKEIIHLLEELNLIQNATLVQKASLNDEKIFHGKEIFSMTEADFNNAYLSVIIIK
ncbi:precorrin-2 C(20)-methyltransferase [Treponema sp.]|uniref:precorrin-2 C(20)-methyltransferase n=1 Tax=Treponema sp. TaxID=166 RepID=UPI0038906CCB